MAAGVCTNIGQIDTKWCTDFHVTLWVNCNNSSPKAIFRSTFEYSPKPPTFALALLLVSKHANKLNQAYETCKNVILVLKTKDGWQQEVITLLVLYE